MSGTVTELSAIFVAKITYSMYKEIKDREEKNRDIDALVYL